MESFNVTFLFFAFGVLLAILNPVGILPQYLTFTAGLNKEELNYTAKRAVLTAGGVLIALSIIGSIVLNFFKITIPAFKIAGAIILFKIAFDMLYARLSSAMTTSGEKKEGVLKDDVSIFPVALPLIAGPGSMTTVIMLSEAANSLVKHLIIVAALLVSCTILYVTFLQAERISRSLGKIGMNVMTRIMGLLIASFAVQFIIDSVVELLPLIPNLLQLHQPVV